MVSFENRVEERLGITFESRLTLREAFVHRSYMNEFPADGKTLVAKALDGEALP